MPELPGGINYHHVQSRGKALRASLQELGRAELLDRAEAAGGEGWWCQLPGAREGRAAAVELGLGRIIALYHRSSTSYQIC